jgi:hypothetical protein
MQEAEGNWKAEVRRGRGQNGQQVMGGVRLWLGSAT